MITAGILPNTFRAISGSLFSTPANWSRGYVPTGSEAVVIAENCTINVSRTVGVLEVKQGVTASFSGSITFNVTTILNSLGHISCSGAPTITTTAERNIINSMSPGSSTFTYSRSGSQMVAGTNYNILNIPGEGTKTSAGNITTSAAVTIGTTNSTITTFELDSYNLTAGGQTTVRYGATLKKSKFGNVIFIGALSIGGSTLANISGLDFSGGNPTVELRGGMLGGGNFFIFRTGLGQWRFTTNSQSIYITYAGNMLFSCPIMISDGITLTLQGNDPSGGNVKYRFNNSIDGDNPLSKLYVRGWISFENGAYATPMSTMGIFDHLTDQYSFVDYNFSTPASYTLPYTSYRALGIGGAAASKSLAGDTSLDGIRYTSNDPNNVVPATLDMGPYTLNISSPAGNYYGGSITVVTNVSQTGGLTKRGPGNVIFPGRVNVGNGFIDFSGNPTLEFRNGFGMTTTVPVANNTGTGSWTLSTNDQTISIPYMNLTYNCPIIISGSISASFTGISATHTFNNTINGTTGSSKLVNAATMNFATTTSLDIMRTGSVDFTSSVNTIAFGGNYSAIIPTNFPIYNLTINGTGTKTLANNTTITNNLTINTAAAVLDLSTYDLVVSGSTSVATGTLRKNTTGNVTFIGNASMATTGDNNSSWDFSGSNATVEFRNGYNMGPYSPLLLNTGVNVLWRFTTNNQSLTINNRSATISGSILISGPITLTIDGIAGGGNPSAATFRGVIDGDNVGSVLYVPTGSNTNTSTVNYQSAIRPMRTGSLSLSAFPNTWVYSSGSQDVTGTTYRNLTFTNGLKTLQGNVSVLNTFSTGSGATSGSVNLNGFTLTNP